MGNPSFTAYTSVTLQDANVNGGTAVALQSKMVTERWEVFAQAPPVAYRDFTDTVANRLSTGRYSGFANPQITVTGIVLVGESTANTVTLALLKAFVSSSAIKTFVSDVTGTISVLVTGLELPQNAGASNGAIEYTLSLLRVR